MPLEHYRESNAPVGDVLRPQIWPPGAVSFSGGWARDGCAGVDEWIAGQGLKIDRSEAISRLVEIGLKAKG